MAQEVAKPSVEQSSAPNMSMSQLMNNNAVPGEGLYDVYLPKTSDGFMCRLGKSKYSGYSCKFIGYRAHRDGSRSFAQTNEVFRNIGDIITAVNRATVFDMTFPEVISKMLSGNDKGVLLRLLEKPVARQTLKVEGECEQQEKGSPTEVSPKDDMRPTIPLADAFECSTSVEAPLSSFSEAITTEKDVGDVPAEYDILLPKTPDGFMLLLAATTHNIYSCQFIGYRQRNGTKCDAEINKLIKNQGDFVVSIDGVDMRGKFFEEVVDFFTLKKMDETIKFLPVRFVGGASSKSGSESNADWDAVVTASHLSDNGYPNTPVVDAFQSSSSLDAPVESGLHQVDASGKCGAHDHSFNNRVIPTTEDTGREASAHIIEQSRILDNTFDGCEKETEVSQLQYDVLLPNTADGFMLVLFPTSCSGYSSGFKGYRRHSSGSRCDAEVKKLVKNKGDLIISVDGVDMRGKSFREVVDFFSAKRKDKSVQLLPVRLMCANVSATVREGENSVLSTYADPLTTSVLNVSACKNHIEDRNVLKRDSCKTAGGAAIEKEILESSLSIIDLTHSSHSASFDTSDSSVSVVSASENCGTVSGGLDESKMPARHSRTKAAGAVANQGICAEIPSFFDVAELSRSAAVDPPNASALGVAASESCGITYGNLKEGNIPNIDFCSDKKHDLETSLFSIDLEQISRVASHSLGKSPIAEPVTNFTRQLISRMPVAFAFALDNGESEHNAKAAQLLWYSNCTSSSQKEFYLKHHLKTSTESIKKRETASHDLSTNAKKAKKARKKEKESKSQRKSQSGRPSQLTESIPAPEPELAGLGWIRESYRRAGDSDTTKHRDKYWYTPKLKKKLRSTVEVRRFLECLERVGGDEDAAFKLIKK